MTTAEAFMMTPKIEKTASAAARTVGRDAAQQTAVSQGAAEVSLSNMKQQEADVWEQLEAAEIAMRMTPEGLHWLRLRKKWIRLSEALERAEAIGRSRHTVCDQQADPLRRLVAAGAKPTTMNEAY